MLKKICNHVVLSILVLQFFSGIAAAEEARIAISTFQVNSKEDLKYLQSGLSSLLPPRISLPGKIAVVDNSAVRRALSPAQANYSLEKKTRTLLEYNIPNMLFINELHIYAGFALTICLEV